MTPTPSPVVGHLVIARKQDPKLSALGTKTLFVPGTVLPGPSDERIRIVGIPPVEPDDKGDYLPDPCAQPKAFDAVHTFAVVWRVSDMLRRACAAVNGLSPFIWQWGDDPIDVHPHFARRCGAWYRRTSKRLEFNYFVAGNETVYTCRSFDMVAHETAHAILDAVKPRWFPGESSLKETGAIHEAFADIVSVFALLDQPDVCADVILACRGDLHTRSFLSHFAEQYGTARRPLVGYLRNADNDLSYDEVDRTSRYELSKVLTGALYDIMADDFDRQVRIPHANRVATLNRVAESVLFRLIRAIYLAPETNARFSDLAEAMIDGEEDAEFKEIVIRQFDRRAIRVRSLPDPNLADLTVAEATCGEFCDTGALAEFDVSG